MKKILEIWEYADPAQVAERRELQTMAAARKAAAKQPRIIQHNQRRIRALVAKIMKGKS